MFKIELLPTDHGDCLLITYGSTAEPRRIRRAPSQDTLR